MILEYILVFMSQHFTPEWVIPVLSDETNHEQQHAYIADLSQGLAELSDTVRTARTDLAASDQREVGALRMANYAAHAEPFAYMGDTNEGLLLKSLLLGKLISRSIPGSSTVFEIHRLLPFYADQLMSQQAKLAPATPGSALDRLGANLSIARGIVSAARRDMKSLPEQLMLERATALFGYIGLPDQPAREVRRQVVERLDRLAMTFDIDLESTIRTADSARYVRPVHFDSKEGWIGLRQAPAGYTEAYKVGMARMAARQALQKAALQRERAPLPDDAHERLALIGAAVRRGWWAAIPARRYQSGSGREYLDTTNQTASARRYLQLPAA